MTGSFLRGHQKDYHTTLCVDVPTTRALAVRSAAPATKMSVSKVKVANMVVHLPSERLATSIGVPFLRQHRRANEPRTATGVGASTQPRAHPTRPSFYLEASIVLKGMNHLPFAGPDVHIPWKPAGTHAIRGSAGRRGGFRFGLTPSAFLALALPDHNMLWPDRWMANFGEVKRQIPGDRRLKARTDRRLAPVRLAQSEALGSRGPAALCR